MELSESRIRYAARPIAAVVAVSVLLGLSAAPALAHGGAGRIEVGDAVTVGPLEIEFPIRITYVGDGHAAEDVSGMSVSGKSTDGGSVGPIDPFTPGDAPGVYLARLTLPSAGTWELTIDVGDPSATAQLAVEVSDDGGEPEVDDTTTSDDAGTPPDAPSASAPSNSEPTIGEVSEPLTSDLAGDANSADDGGFPIVVVALIAVVAAGVLGWIVFAQSRGGSDAGA